MPPSRWSTARVTQRLRRDAAARPGAARRRAGGVCAPGRRADAADRRRAAIEEQIERLEIHHLASPDGDLHFALLSDWTDARRERRRRRRSAARRGRRRHRTAQSRATARRPAAPRFLLLHRRRVWNAGEGRWIGWERKRGKLHELNRLLRGATDTTFLPIGGARRRCPPDVRYVITLDADTRLPRDTVRRLIGKMAHPLNRPRFDAAARPRGRGLRASCSRASRRRCRSAAKARCSSASSPARAASIPMPPPSPTSIRTCSAKAPTPARASTTSTPSRPRWPAACRTTTLLSHDLFEGIFARAGLASDIEVVEEFPVALRRRRRAPAPLGARRLAVAAVDLRPRPRSARDRRAQRRFR